jgi:hypothetical protein
MSLPFLQLYLYANALLLVACGLSVSSRTALAALGWRLPCSQQLRAVYGLIALCLTLPVAVALLQQPSFLPPAAQIWSGYPLSHAAPGHAYSARVSVLGTATEVRLDRVTQLALACFLGGLCVAAIRIAGALRSTLAVLAGAHPIRQLGSLRILASDDVSVPFSFWMPGCSAIVVPMQLLEHPGDLRIAIRHEGQHHRQGDTLSIYALTLLRGACFPNPAVHLLCSHLHELQELACDAAVAGRRGVTEREYCDCLLRVAERALASAAPGSWMRMAAVKSSTLLARRMQVLLQRPREALRPAAAGAAMAMMLAGLVTTALALPEAVQDRRISEAQAAAMAARAQEQTSFPIAMNPQVLVQLNQLLGTPAGRDFVRSSLRRMHQSEPVVSHELQQLELPLELLAMPLIESGYKNLPPEANRMHSAGIWQMIPTTARMQGLAVEADHDDRLDVTLESQAAGRYLSGLFAELGDWDLAVLAYNSGKDFVESSIRKAGTRDAFRLTQLGYEYDPHYLPRVMAAIIIVKNEKQLALD